MPDATYNLIVEEYPTMTVGTTDRDKHYHPFGIGVTSNETEDDFKFIFQSVQSAYQRVTGETYLPHTLIADNAPAITNGFTAAFGEPAKVLLC